MSAGELVADAAHELEDGLLLLDELIQQAGAQQILLLRCRRGDLGGLAVKRLQQGLRLVQVPRHGLPGRGSKVSLQLALEGFVLAHCLAQPLGLANPLGLDLFALILGLEHVVEGLLRLLQQ